MRYAIGLTVHHPIPDDLCSGTFLSRFAVAAEQAGFDAIYLTEHPAPGDDWLRSGGHDALDPFVALGYAAAVTERLRLFTNLTVLPYRNPFMLAKAVATLDRLSHGRVILGAGVGYLESEYAAVGVAFEERNALFDESLALLRRIWTGGTVVHDGLHLRAEGNTARPAPVQDPVPIWLGGNSKLTLRRVAAHGQGWMPLPNPRALGGRRRSRHLDDLDDLDRYLDELRRHCADQGRTDPIDIAFMTMAGGSPSREGFDASAHRDSLAELADHGVTWNVVTVGGGSPDDAVAAVHRYGEQVIAG